MMKMNFKFATMMAAALVLGMSSCSNDNDPAPDGPQGEKNAKLSVTLVDGNVPVTYAAPGGATDPATAQEGNIVDGNVYIFDGTATTSTLEAVVAHNALTAIQLTPGTKTVYFVANTGTNAKINPATPTIGVTTIASLLAEKVTGLVDIEELTEETAKPSGNFYISNVVSAGTVNVAAGVTSTLALNIGRGVAKINVELPATAIQPSTGTLEAVKYMVRNNPVETFLVPRYDLAGQVQTPLYNEIYNAANYFDNGTVTVTGPTNDPVINIGGLKDADGTATNVSYAVENAHAAPLMGNSTYALIEGVFEPNTTVDATGSSTSYTQGDDFWRIQYIETLGSGDVIDRGFYGKFFTVEPTNLDAEYLNADGIKPAAANGGTVSSQVVKYIAGKCYYYLYIGDPQGVDDTAKKTVERNQYYYLTIKSISDCGLGTPNPTSPGVKPSTNAYLNASLETSPWGVVGGAGGIETGI